MLLGSCGTALAAGGGFCGGSKSVIAHLRLNAAATAFSASLPALLAVCASEGIDILRNTLSIFQTLQENVRAARAILDRVDWISIPSHPASPIVHIYVRQRTEFTRESEYEAEERLLQSVVEETLSQGVLVTRTKNLKAQEMVKTRPSIRLALTSSLTKKETEKAVNVLKTVLVKVLGRRR